MNSAEERAESSQMEEPREGPIPATPLETGREDNLIFDKSADFVLAEYNTLRTELLQRVSTRYQIMTLAFSAFSAILAVQAFGASSIGGVYLVLLYPVLAFVLLNVYIANSHGLHTIEEYIKKHIETPVKKRVDPSVEDKFGWHTYYDKHYGGLKQLRPPFTLGGRFIFPATAILAIIAALLGVGPEVSSREPAHLTLFFVIAFVFLAGTLGLAIWDLVISIPQEDRGHLFDRGRLFELIKRLFALIKSRVIKS